MNSNQTKTFDLRDFVDQLTPAKGKNRYICPVCEGNNLTIDEKSGAYQCWSGCECKDIRNAIAPRNAQFSSRSHRKILRQKSSVKIAPAPIPVGEIELARHSRQCFPPGRRKNFAARKGKFQITTYRYSPTQWIERRDWLDADKPKGRDKKFSQWHLNQEGKAIANAGDAPWPPYHRGDITPENCSGKWIISVEGEKCADAIAALGIVATTLKGGTWSESEIESMLLVAKQAGAIGHIHITDNDEPGRKKSSAIAKAAAKLRIPFIEIDPCSLDPDLPEKGDIADWIENHQGTMNPEELIARLEREIHHAAELARGLENDCEEENKPKKKPSADQLAKEIAEEYRERLAFNNESGTWMRYEADFPGVWSPETEEFIESAIFQILCSKGISGFGQSYVRDVLKLVRHCLIERQWNEPSPKEMLPFINGILDIHTGKLLSHSPGYKFTWQLPRSHNLLANQWPRINAFLDHLSAGNQSIKKILLCYCNAVLKGRSDLQVFLHLIGLGGTGKGTFARLITALIGQKNIHTSSVDEWCNNRFEGANAYRKRLVLFPDEDKQCGKLGKFLSLTGEDPIRSEEKGKKAFSYTFDGMVLVCSNLPIFTGDAASRVKRRVIPIPCNNPVPSHLRRNLQHEFEHELDAFTNYILGLCDEEVKNTLQGTSTVPQVTLEFWENRIRVDSIAAWLNECIVYDPMARTQIGSDRYEGEDGEEIVTLFGSYNRRCRQVGDSPKALKSFSPDLLELCRSVLGWECDREVTKNGKYLRGIRLRTDADGHIPTHDYFLNQQTILGDGSGDGSGDGLESRQSKDCSKGDDSTLSLKKNQNLSFNVESQNPGDGETGNGESETEQKTINKKESEGSPVTFPESTTTQAIQPSPSTVTASVTLEETRQLAIALSQCSSKLEIDQFNQDLQAIGGIDFQQKIWATLWELDQSAYVQLMQIIKESN